jgi:adenylate kinase
MNKKMRVVAVVVPENTAKIVIKSLNYDEASGYWGVLEQIYNEDEIRDMSVDANADKYLNSDSAAEAINALENIIVDDTHMCDSCPDNDKQCDKCTLF